MAPKVSIIIPIYNAEKNLHRCIDSVLKQDYEDFELILVDDGSKDFSGDICDFYASEDSRIRVVHKENSGVSDTRNLAISLATGTYLQFLDADDWITPDATGLLVRSAEENACDMVIADFYRVIGERLAPKGNIREDRPLTREEFALEMMEHPADFYYGVLWNKLYRRDIIQKYNLSMNKNISWCEDFIFNMEYIRHVEQVYALSVPIYYYVKTPGSLVSQGMSISKTLHMKRTVFKCYKEFYQDIFNDKDYDKIQMQVYRFLIDAAGDGVVGPVLLPKTLKLGDERISVSLRIAEGSGILFDNYRDEKLLDRCLETVSLKHELSFEETKLLFYFSQQEEDCTSSEISKVTGIGRTNVKLSILSLIGKKFIKYRNAPVSDEEKEEERQIEVEILEHAEPVISDLILAKSTYLQLKYSGLTEEEIEQYEMLNDKIHRNVQKALS